MTSVIEAKKKILQDHDFEPGMVIYNEGRSPFKPRKHLWVLGRRANTQ